MEFNKLDLHIRETFKKTFIAKKIYLDKLSCHVNQCLVNLIIDK